MIVDVDPQTGLISKLCTESGFVTNSYLKVGSEELENLKNNMPEVSVFNMVQDDTGAAWIPMMQSTNRSVIFPSQKRDSKSLEDFIWVVAPILPLPEEERGQYPNPDNPDGGYMDSYVAFEQSTTFERGNFTDAFDGFIMMSKDPLDKSEEE